VKAGQARYHETNKVRRNERASTYYRSTYYPANKDRIRVQQRAWEQTHPEMLLLKRMRRLSRTLSRPYAFTTDDLRRCYGAFGGKCAYCDAKATTTDHFVPLAALDCPGTIPANMVPACGSCNFSKSHRDASAWLTHKLGFTDAAIRLTRIAEYLALVR